MNPKVFSIYMLLLFPVIINAGPVKRALKALEKVKYDKVEKILDKRIEKDTLNPGAYYVYSRLFITSDFDRYNIDSSYYYINRAIGQYPATEDKARKKWGKIGINDSTLQAQKLLVDSIAFARALEKHSVKGYQYFIDHFPSAPQLDKAIELRNELAYREAKSINTYEAYKKFLDTYPDARQITEATELYEFLLYENKTKDRKLSSYINFLKEYPRTDYTTEAEKNIFELITSNNTSESYIDFINRYPKSKYAEKAINFLYHISKAYGEPSDFFRKYKGLPVSDSLKAVATLESYTLFPVFEKGLYGFMSSKGNLIIPPTHKGIKPEYLCGNIQSDVLIVGNGNSQKIIARNNQPVITSTFEQVDDLGYGMLRIMKSAAYTLFHKAGDQILPPEYEDIELLGSRYLKFKQSGLWGLKTFAGRHLLEPEYDDIFVEGKFIILEKRGLLAITNDKSLADKANNTPINMQFLYDEVEHADDQYLFAYRDDMESVIDEKLQAIIPLQKQQIRMLKNGWLIRKNNRYLLYNEDFVPFSDATIDKAFFNDHWLALKRADKWTLLEQEGNLFPDYKYDSLRLLSDNIALSFSNNNNTTAHFSGGETVVLQTNAKIQLLKPVSSQKFAKTTEYLVTENKNGFKIIYDKKGKQIISGPYKSISILGPDLISFERYGKKALADTTGKIVLPLRYSGIGNYSNGYVSLLQNKKFGLFNKEKNIYIRPVFDIMLQPYNDTLLIASINNKLGIIDIHNKKVAPFQFDQVNYWTDSLALVKMDREWNIYDIYNNTFIYKPFDDFKYVRQSSGETVLVIYSKAGYGVLSNTGGELIPPAYNDLLNIGSQEAPVYFAEKHVSEADFYVVVYYDENGKDLRKQAFNGEDYDMIYCDY